MDLFSLDSDILGALDRAVGGKLIVTTEYMIRVVGGDHLDLMVGGLAGSGPAYVIHVTVLDDSKEIVLADMTLPIDDHLDEPTKLALLQVYTRCLVEGAERERRKLTLKVISFTFTSEKEARRTDQLSRCRSPEQLHPVCRGGEDCAPDFRVRERSTRPSRACRHYTVGVVRINWSCSFKTRIADRVPETHGRQIISFHAVGTEQFAAHARRDVCGQLTEDGTYKLGNPLLTADARVAVLPSLDHSHAARPIDQNLQPDHIGVYKVHDDDGIVSS